MNWNLADAKSRLSEVITLALTTGPQRIARRGQVVVVISEEEYDQLTGAKPDFKTFLLNGPDLSGLDLARDCSPSRDISW